MAPFIWSHPGVVGENDICYGRDNFNFELMAPGEPERKFFPSGAIFFFAVLLLFYATLWFVIYWIMIARS